MIFDLISILFPFLLILGGLLGLPFFLVHLTKRERNFDPNLDKAKAFYRQHTGHRRYVKPYILPFFSSISLPLIFESTSLEATAVILALWAELIVSRGLIDTLKEQPTLLLQLAIYLIASTLMYFYTYTSEYKLLYVFLISPIGFLLGIRLHYHLVLTYYYKHADSAN